MERTAASLVFWEKISDVQRRTLQPARGSSRHTVPTNSVGRGSLAFGSHQGLWNFDTVRWQQIQNGCCQRRNRRGGGGGGGHKMAPATYFQSHVEGPCGVVAASPKAIVLKNHPSLSNFQWPIRNFAGFLETSGGCWGRCLCVLWHTWASLWEALLWKRCIFPRAIFASCKEQQHKHEVSSFLRDSEEHVPAAEDLRLRRTRS